MAHRQKNENDQRNIQLNTYQPSFKKIKIRKKISGKCSKIIYIVYNCLSYQYFNSFCSFQGIIIFNVIPQIIQFTSP